MCCVMEGRWKILSVSYQRVKSLSGIDRNCWVGSGGLCEQRCWSLYYEEGVDDMREMVSCWGKHKFIVG